MSTIAFTWGGNNDDVLVDVVTDGVGNVYTCGQSLSTGMTSGNWDAIVYKFDYTLVMQWGLYWGGPLIETTNACTADTDNNNAVFIVGSTTSVPSLSYAKEDMFIVKISSDGIPLW